MGAAVNGEAGPLFDREASELEYHARVLARAADQGLPLLERVRFLAIFTRLTDEFYRVRVATLAEDGGADDLVASLHRRFRDLLADQRSLLVDELLPALADEGLRLLAWSDLGEAARAELSRDFERRIKPVLTPLAVGPAHPFPFISDLSLSIGVTLSDGRGPGFGRLKVPPALGRFLSVDDADGTALVAIEEVIAGHVDEVFPGREVTGWHTFRVTRNADYEVDRIGVEDLLEVVAAEVVDRRFGRAVRLEVDTETPNEVCRMLIRELDLGEIAVFHQPRPLDLGALNDLYGLGGEDLRAPAWEPVTPENFDVPDLFAMIRNDDALVHVPYESFAATTQRFIELAADDPNVLALKQTLYRTSEDSEIVRALIRAAEAGKQVTALVELKARFDEKANIAWAEELESAGVHVVFGFVDLKTHSKTALVVRAEEDGQIRRYGHIATGNYNPSTAGSYEDLGLFTADPVLTEDLAELFNMLTTNSREAGFKELLVAPVGLADRLAQLIDEQASPGGRITIKVNHLSHEPTIERLYAASQQGAEIDLIVRSICRLRPGVPGLSERIRVRSIVGRFLEHSRIYRFGDRSGDATYLLGSADLMPRNLEHRVEAVVPVTVPALRQRLDTILDLCLQDTELAWELDPDGAWRRTGSDGDRLNLQETLSQEARERAAD
jgi:polyphosphate kinase